ncbi:RlpA-like double-psi beta-barrel-protein domain-containing protein-containing protein [Immersiella caudata]|uniref:Cellulase n=1 Tax=Immersiella caudata TaxID=314043 RepID=A0AA40CC57_9PEZI|nr:RlpA-like double-psi beta-barrel-protein domain-containing protein-containing protein [Immersiella caudata]
MRLPLGTLVAILPFYLEAVLAQAQGSGKTTRYWDCCKPSCAWPRKGNSPQPVLTCDKNDRPLSDGGNTKSGCENGGNAFMCSSQSPWAVNDTLAYGWAAVNIAGSNEATWCCACYELTFTSGPVSGKKMVVQATNTGGDLGNNHFDIAMPGGGVGIFNACTNQYGAPPNGWGERYGGVTSKSACANFPAALKAGCNWRYDWFQGADNPNVNFRQVACPAAITEKSKCVRQRDSIDQTPTGPKEVPTWTP